MREIKKLQSCPEHSVSHSSLLFLLLALYYVSGGEYPEYGHLIYTTLGVPTEAPLMLLVYLVF